MGGGSVRGAVILAGGKGSRMGGEKHLRTLGGKPLMLHVVEKAGRVADEVIVVLKNDDDPQIYRKILPDTVKVVLDSVKSDAPIVGIKTGGDASASEYSAFLSCDLAFLNPDVLGFLFSQAADANGAIPEWPDGLLEPLHAVYRTKPAAEAAEDALSAEEYRTIAVAKRLGNVKHIAVDELRRFDPDLLTFFNVNTAEDLAKAEKLLAH
jgi:molybdopterin-guanine dinucleotide biosynthesis protein A